MKEHPILFSAPTVPAILEGRKTQTRRVVKHPEFHGCMTGDCPHVEQEFCDVALFEFAQKDCPYGQPGDRLWVREQYWAGGKWAPNGLTATGRKKWRFVPVGGSLRFQENPPKQPAKRDGECGWVYRHARYMPKAHSRITLEITDVRVQRVQEISAADAEAEGVLPWIGDKNKGHGKPLSDKWARECFARLWDSINAKRGFGWDVNPWTWALTFKRVEGGR